MPRSLKRRALVALAATVCLVAASAAQLSASQPACWPEWSDAAAVVERERLASAKGVHVLARQHTGGELLRITLCEQGGAYVYRLLVRDDQGRVSSHTVDARRPFHR